jgi:outer membrane protein
MKRFVIGAIFTLSLFGLVAAAGSAGAAEKTLSIATVKVQEVLAKSLAGQAGQKALQAKADGFQKDFQQDQDELAELQKQIEMKSSVWSPEVRDEKERDYQRKLRALQTRSDDAKYELGQMQKKVMEPILKDLNDVIDDLGKKKGYTLIMVDEGKGLASRVGLIYVDDSLDITAQVIKELDARTKK